MIMGRLRALPEELRERVAHGLLDDRLVGRALLVGLGQRLRDARLGLGDEGVPVGAERQAPRDQLRLAHQAAGLAVDGDDDGRDAVLRQQLPVAQHDLAHVAHAEAVDVDDAVLDALRSTRAPAFVISRQSPLSSTNTSLLGDADLLGQSARAPPGGGSRRGWARRTGAAPG